MDLFSYIMTAFSYLTHILPLSVRYESKPSLVRTHYPLPLKHHLTKQEFYKLSAYVLGSNTFSLSGKKIVLKS